MLVKGIVSAIYENENKIAVILPEYDNATTAPLPIYGTATVTDYAIDDFVIIAFFNEELSDGIVLVKASDSGSVLTNYYTKSQTDTLLSGKSDVGHSHNDIYYAKNEIDVFLSGKSDTGHTHDDRYYTETEIDSLISGYYTKAEVDVLLAGKADSSHTHDDRYYTESEIDTALSDYLPLTGGTMSGDILFSDSGTSTRQIRFTVGVNDCARIAAGATATNGGWIEIATADDGTEPIYVRQYLYDASDSAISFGRVSRELVLLNANGDTEIPGNVTLHPSSDVERYIAYKTSQASYSMIRFLPASDAYGHGISIGGGGATIIGGGESATACQGLLSSNGDERMIIANDGDIEFYANCQNGTSSAKKIYFNTAGGIVLNTGADTALLKNTYNSIEYNLIRNHNNGNISVSASGSGLYLGYENTTSIDFLNGKMSLFSSASLTVGYATSTAVNQVAVKNSYSDVAIYASTGNHGLWSNTKSGWIIYVPNSSSDSVAYVPRALQAGGNVVANGGAVYSIVSSGEAQLVARNGAAGNRIYLYSNSAGNVGIYSYDSNNTARGILNRANNSSDITAYGAWTFNSGVKNYHGTYGQPITSVSTDGGRVSYMAMASNNRLVVYGQNGTAGSSTGTQFIFTGTSSDIRLKKNITDCAVIALPLINSIRMREFDWKEDGRHQTIGFVADELEELDEKLSIGGGYAENGEMSVKSVDTFYLLGYLVKAIQELSAEVSRLKGVV